MNCVKKLKKVMKNEIQIINNFIDDIANLSFKKIESVFIENYEESARLRELIITKIEEVTIELSSSITDYNYYLSLLSEKQVQIEEMIKKEYLKHN